MSLDNDDSVFEQALRADLPSQEQEARLRKRMLAVGVGVAGTTAAVSTQASWGAAFAAKVGALSWPVTLALSAAVATPLIAVPVWLTAPAKSSSAASRPVLLAASAALPRAGAEALVSEVPHHAESPVGDPPASDPRAQTRGRAPLQNVSASSPGLPGPPDLPSRSAAVAFPVATERPSAVPAERVRPSSTLGAETQLLDRAFAELAAGHRAAAAALIAEHEREFPRGLLRQERERARARLNQTTSQTEGAVP
jgi:hypothetical protein